VALWGFIYNPPMSYIAHGSPMPFWENRVELRFGYKLYIGSGLGFGAALQYLTGRKVYSDAAIGIVTTASFAWV